MGLFDFFKKKETTKANQENTVLIAMPIFNNGETYRLEAIIDDLKIFWGLTISEIEGDDNSAVFKIDGEMVALGYMPVPIPWGDIEGTAQYAYNWPTAREDLGSHTGHVIVSIMTAQKKSLERFTILSKLLCSILTTSNAIGVYKGSQSLLIPKSQYLAQIDELKENGTPIILWVYIGVRKLDNGNSVYTYGLSEFGKQEMEILNSKLSLDELYEFLTNLTSYVIGSNITFKSGETVGYTDNQKVKITSSKGQFVEGQSLKLGI